MDHVCADARAVRAVCFAPRTKKGGGGGADTAESLAAYGTASGLIYLFPLPSLHCSNEADFNHGAEVNCLAFSPQSLKYLVSGGDDGYCKFWDLASKRLVYALFLDNGALVYSLQFSKDETKLIASSFSGLVAVFNLSSDMAGGGGATVRAHMRAQNVSVVMSISCDDAFTRAMAANWDGTCSVWDLQHNALERLLKAHASDCNAAAICTRTARFGVTGSNDMTALLWDLNEGKVLRKFIGHTAMIVSVALKSYGDGSRFDLLTASWDGAVRFYENFPVRATGKDGDGEKGVIVAKHAPKKAACVAFSPSGNWFLSGGFDSRVVMGDLRSLDRARVLLLAHCPNLPMDIVYEIRHMLY